ncbi:hypothetical protein RR48_12193 [Papilio machaon]|uniref:Uncharacterized protein n=1 Tax=Papilio machaon TaxID=76193 RepID=A0A194QTW7_PAPMA|nr:hypothetical protein RR48_12193 [Papilio machaon]
MKLFVTDGLRTRSGKPTLFINTLIGCLVTLENCTKPLGRKVVSEPASPTTDARKIRERLEIDTQWQCDASACTATRTGRTHRALAGGWRQAARCNQLGRHRGRRTLVELAARAESSALVTVHCTRLRLRLRSRYSRSTHTRFANECVKRSQVASRLSRTDGESVGERLRIAARAGADGARAAPHRPLPPMNDNNGRRSTRPQTE